MPQRSSLRSTSFALFLAFALLTAACSGDEPTAESSPPADTTESAGAAGAESEDEAGAPSEGTPERFTGTDADFYDSPDPLPAGEPGELIRVMEVGPTDGGTTLKVMYHSRDAQGRDRAVTALVTYPAGPPPDGGWPVISTAPGTVGVAAHCAASHRSSEAPGWGVEGVRVMTDYVGLGVTGGPLHPYLSRPSEGYSVIDRVRAARNLSETGAGDRWLSVGHSQGGHGALSASELAADYAPELELLGTVALAPAAMLDRVYGGIDPIVTTILTVMSLYGGAGEHPEIVLEDYVAPELAAVDDVLEDGCLDEITNALIPLVAEGTVFTNDPRETEPARSLLLPNDVGNVKVDAPLFLASGTADDRVVIERVHDLYSRLCETGQVTELTIVEGADHSAVIPATADQTAAWLQARLDGEPATDSCEESPTAGVGTTAGSSR